MAKSRRSKATDISNSIRKLIYNRAYFRCELCSGTTFLGIAHIHLSRNNGGLGVKENLMLLCQCCHSTLDQGTKEQRVNLKKYCVEYLEKHYGKIDIETLRYNKRNY